MATTSAGAIGVTLSADTVQFDSAMDKSAAVAERSLQRTARAQQAAKNDADRFISSIQRQVDSFGLSGTALLAYEARLKGVSDQAQPLIDRLNKMRDAQAGFNQSLSGPEMLAGAAATKANAHEMEGFSFQTAGAKRELLVLAHELSQGNYSRFGGSLLVLGERTGAASLLFSGFGIAALAAAAAVGGFAFAAIKGAMESDALAKSLVLTGNAAGITEGSFNAMARAVAQGATVSIGASREILQGLVSAGTVGPKAIQPMAEAIALLQKNTGADTDKIVADFAKMGDGVAKWAEEHNKSLNFITAAQYEYIKRLEEQGKAEEAELVVAKALSDHLATKIPQSLGYLQTALKDAGNVWHNFWDAALDVGRTQTVEQKIAAIDDRLAKRAPSLGIFTLASVEAAASDTPEDQQALRLRKVGLLQDQQQEHQKAWLDSQKAANEKAGIAAVDYLDKLNGQIKGVDRLKKAMDELHRQQDAYQSTGGALTAAQIAAQEAEVRKQNTPAPDHSAQKLDNRFQDRLVALTAEGIKLDAEAENFRKYGKAINDSNLALLNLEIAQGKLRGLDPARIKQLQDLAKADDSKAEALSLEKASIAADKRTKSIEAAADAEALNARQIRIASELVELENSGIAKGTALFNEKAASRAAAVNKSFDDKLAIRLRAESAAVDEQVTKLDLETSQIGASTVERLKFAEVLKLEAQARKDIVGNEDKSAEIWAVEAANADKATAAIQRNYDAQRTSEAGNDTYFRKYSEDATNAAKTAESLASKSVGALEDSLTQLLSGQKVNFKSLVDSLISEIIRLQVIKPLLADIFGANGSNGSASEGLGGILGSLGKAVGFGSSGAAGASAAGAGDALSAAAGSFGSSGAVGSLFSGFSLLANGTNLVPYDGMPAILHKGEAVVPAAFNPSAGGRAANDSSMKPMVVNQTFNVSAPASRETQSQVFSAAYDGMLRASRRDR